MDTQAFNQRFGPLAEAISGVEANVRDSDFWISVGKTKLDHQLMQLADLYIEASSEQREEIPHQSFHVQSGTSWPLFVDLAILLLDDSNPRWLQRGLAIACVETVASIFVIRSPHL